MLSDRIDYDRFCPRIDIRRLEVSEVSEVSDDKFTYFADALPDGGVH